VFTGAGREDFLDLGANLLPDGWRSDAGATIGQELVEVRLEAEPVAVAIRVQVVAAIREGFQALLDAADGEPGFGDGSRRRRFPSCGVADTCDMVRSTEL
jgi:hypothetical protein